MKLINETEYRSDDLRKLIIAGFKAEGVRHTGYYVYVEKIRGNQVHGYGYYNRKCLCLKLPKIYRENYGTLTIDFITRLAQVLVHEIGHTLNLRHKEMVNSWDIDVSWSEGMVVRKAERKPKPKRDLKQERYDHAKKMLAKNATKLKRAQTLVKKWKAKIKYYEKSFKKAASK